MITKNSICNIVFVRFHTIKQFALSFLFTISLTFSPILAQDIPDLDLAPELIAADENGLEINKELDTPSKERIEAQIVELQHTIDDLKRIILQTTDASITHRAMASKTFWMCAKAIVLHQFLVKALPTIEELLGSIDNSPHEQTTRLLVGSMIVGLFTKDIRKFWEDLRSYLWTQLPEPGTKELSEPLRSIILSE